MSIKTIFRKKQIKARKNVLLKRMIYVGRCNIRSRNHITAMCRNFRDPTKLDKLSDLSKTRYPFIVDCKADVPMTTLKSQSLCSPSSGWNLNLAEISETLHTFPLFLCCQRQLWSSLFKIPIMKYELFTISCCLGVKVISALYTKDSSVVGDLRVKQYD